jgi:hypothetical protein
MEKSELLKKLKALNEALEDYLDNVDMSEADDEKKSDKKDKEKED